MRYSNTIKTNRLSALKTLIDSGSGNGRLEILQDSTILVSYELSKAAFTSLADDGTFCHKGITLVNSSVAAVASGTANTARIVKSDGTVVLSGISVFKYGAYYETSGAFTISRFGIFLSNVLISVHDVVSVSSTRINDSYSIGYVSLYE